jgi:hypothetical protein
MIATRALAALMLSALMLPGCNELYWVCEPTDEARVSRLPEDLGATGLYADIHSSSIATDVRSFAPQFALWSDGSDKRRWIRLPAGSRIDTSDMNDWRLPAGTRLWKQFSLNGKRIETRLFEKLGPGDDDWVGLAYVWNESQTEAVAAPEGAIDARGTSHDVPASGECMACHRGRKSRVLGFSAIQLAGSHTDGDLDLSELASSGFLTDLPQTELSVPGNDVERGALGYLHANCGHCHNRARPSGGDARCFDPKTSTDYTLSVDRLASPEETPAYRTAIGEDIERGDPAGSRLIELVSERGMFQQMPPLATERVDHDAVSLLTRWISEM